MPNESYWSSSWAEEIKKIHKMYMEAPQADTKAEKQLKWYEAPVVTSTSAPSGVIYGVTTSEPPSPQPAEDTMKKKVEKQFFKTPSAVAAAMESMGGPPFKKKGEIPLYPTRDPSMPCGYASHQNYTVRVTGEVVQCLVCNAQYMVGVEGGKEEREKWKSVVGREYIIFEYDPDVDEPKTLKG